MIGITISSKTFIKPGLYLSNSSANGCLILADAFEELRNRRLLCPLLEAI